MNKFIKIFFLLIIVLFLNKEASADAFWIRQSSPSNRNFKNCFFANSNTGWISGDSGTIIHTSNGGLAWDIQTTGTLNDIQALFFVNERIGWAIAWEIFPDSTSFFGTRILKTTNGGINWINFMYPDTNRFIKTIYFLDSLRGFMGGAPLTLVYTTNGGIKWIAANTDSLQIGFPIENINFFNAQIGYACGGFRDLAGAMWTTTNGGINWRSMVVGPEPLNDIFIFNQLKAIAVGGDFEYGSSYVRTIDQGLSWYYDTLGTFGVASAVDFRTQAEGWIALGIAQKFSYTVDSGNTWTAIYTPDSIPIFDVQFTDSLHGWAVGYDGAILKYNSTMLTNKNEYEKISPNSFTLYQNYPNPFNPNTIINYELQNINYVELKVYDALGKEISTLVQGRQGTGKYYINFEGRNLASGIYFYELKVENSSQVRKMLLLR